jgi:RecJ-like exonuclease
MHTKPMAESEGKFDPQQPEPNVTCRKCGVKGQVTCRTWNSSCGGYEDYKYTCACGYVWWADGIDS